MILKAGTIIINKNKIGLIYRDYYNDYTFPKGHLEDNESLIACAIRETNEETKREVELLMNDPIYIDEYVDSNNNPCKCYYYLVKDNGNSDNTSIETHELKWIDYNEVNDILSFKSLKIMWNEIKDTVYKYLEE